MGFGPTKTPDWLDGQSWSVKIDQPATRQWIAANQSVLDRVHVATQKPRLGFLYGSGQSVADLQLFGVLTVRNDHQPLISVLAPHASLLRHAGSLLAADAELARSQGDAARFVRDIDALLGLTRQLRNEPTVWIQIVGAYCFFQVENQVGLSLRDQPTLLSDEQLRAIVHQMAGPQVAADLFSIETESALARDVAQRVFTDDGNGDGRLTRDGIEFLRQCDGAFGRTADPTLQKLLTPAAPVAMLAMPSRRQFENDFARLYAEADAVAHKPAREVNWADYKRVVAELTHSGKIGDSYFTVLNFVPAQSQLSRMAETYLGRRDGMMVAITLELSRRKSGKYPESLAEITPSILPSIPADRISGQAVRYKLADGKPLIYSVGADRIDNGGEVFPKINPVEWGVDPQVAPKGDWILYPPQADWN